MVNVVEEVNRLRENIVKRFAERVKKVSDLLDTYDLISDLDRDIAKEIMKSDEFRNLLEMLKELVDECERRVGYNDEKVVRYRAIRIPNGRCLDYLVEDVLNKPRLLVIVWNKERNEYGTEWLSENNPDYRPAVSLDDIKSFLSDLEDGLTEAIRAKFDEMNALAKS